ncbi:MAG: hypothetical protein LBF95_04450, partial [Treponema sp.]|nr:hypothetical protein [Treponema sp.]
MNSKLSKVIALVLVQCHLAAMLPALELRTDLRQGMARLEHYLDRAAAERSAQSWEQIAQSGLEAAMYEWESGAVWLLEQDGGAWLKERERAETSYRKELETAYVRWASERVYSERAGFEGSGLEAALRETAGLWESSGQIADVTDAGGIRAAWEQVAAEIVDQYLNGWEEQHGAVYTELESRFQDLGLSAGEREALIRETAEKRRIEVLREYNRIALAEGNRFMTELLYDQESVKKLAAGQAASVIARELAREAEEAADERARELFNQLDTMIAAEDQEDIELNAGDWLNQFRTAFEEALARWEEAELGFLAARSEWEHDAEDAFLAGEEAWNQAYLELTERQKSWETAILLKLDEGFAAWQENQSRLAAELEDARAEFLAAAEESRGIKEKMLESQEAIYIRSRQMMNLVSQGIESWFSFWDDKYLMVYTHIKNAAETPLAERFAGLDYDLIKNLLTNLDIDDLTNPNKKNAQTLRTQIELWREACLALRETKTLSSIHELLSDELVESADALINADTGWLSLALKYREFADDSARRLYELAGSVVENSGTHGELTGELLKAEALLNYWDREFEVAEALHRYAQETSSTIEDAATTREELEKARTAYEESARDYQGITDLIGQKSMALGKTQENFENAQAILAGFRQEVEDAQRDYLNIIAAMNDMNPALVYAELTELATVILDFWKGKLHGEGGEERSLEDTIHTYYQLSREYNDILHSLELRSLINSLEAGSGTGQDGIAELEAKAEEARSLARSGREEDLRAEAGRYPVEFLLINAWGADTEGETRSWSGKEFLIELDLAYRETEDPVERENLLALMCWAWEEAASYYDGEALLRKEAIEYLITGTLPDPDNGGAERAAVIQERYGQYDARLLNQKNREAGQRVAELIAALKAGLDTTGKALEYTAALREAGTGLNESGQEALESFIASFLEYAAVRDYESGVEIPADRESREKEYQEALASYTAYDSWRYGIYDDAGLAEITGSSEFAALADQVREEFLFHVESGDTLALSALIENLRNTSLEELLRRYDALIYTCHYLAEQEESRFSWLTTLASHRARINSGIIDSKSLTAIEPLFAPNAKETYLKGLEEKIYRIAIWFDTPDEWDQTQYRETADTALVESARAALEAGWQDYQNELTMDSRIYLLIYDELEKLRYINEGSETLGAMKAAKEQVLTQAQKKYNDYANNEYNAAVQAIDQSCADYNATVDLADEYYRVMTEARLQLRKRQEVYDWAESVYLKDFGSSYDEYYLTPQEKLSQVRYARERALIAVEVLRELSDGGTSGVPARIDADYSQALESYRESRRAYYLAQVSAYETAQSIVRMETIVREAELAEAVARSRLVGADTSVSPGSYEMVNLVADGNGGYKPVLIYTLEPVQQNGTTSLQAVRKPDSKIDAEAFRVYFGDDTGVSIEKTGRTVTMTLAEWEAGEWLKKTAGRGVDYLNDVMLASLYIKYCSRENSDEGDAWFKNGGDPRLNGNYTLGDVPLGTSFHGINVKNRYDEARRTALQEAYNRVMGQKGGEDDIACYLLYRDRNLLTGGDSYEEDLLKSRALQKLSESIGKTHERYVVDVRTYTGIAVGYTAAGVAFTIGAFFNPSLWALSAQSFSMAATFYALAGTAEFARKQINSLWGDVKNLGTRYTDIVNGLNTRFRDQYNTWMEASSRLKTEQENLNLLYYGSTRIPDGEGKTAALSYDSFRTGLANLFSSGNNTVTFNDAISVYSKSLYEESNAGSGLTVIGAISILNAALEGRTKNQQDLMNVEIERLKGEQQDALGRYGETMNTALAIPQDRQAELRALALRAGDPSLGIAERREASAEYERLIAELCLDTEDLRGEIWAALDRAFGDNTWNSTLHGQTIVDLEGELFGSLTHYSRPTETYTEHEILLLREVGLAALDTDTAFRLSVKEQEWGLIFGDFLNQYSAWQEQVNQIRQAGLSEWNKARSRMNEGYNTWRQNFNDEYQEKTAVWDLNYLAFVNEKQLWIEDQYIYAVNVGNSGLFEYAEGSADQVIEQTLAKLSVGRMNREHIDPLSYTDMLLEDSILEELLARTDNLAGRGDLGTQRVRTAVKRTSAAENLAQSAKLIGEMDNDMRNAAAKLAAQQAQQLIEEAIDQLYKRLNSENRSMLEWEEHLVQSYGYRIDGQIRRMATVDSALLGNYTVTQTVHRYEFYVPDSSPVSGVDLSAAALKNLDADTIMYMAETARGNLNKWGETIFGRVENNRIAEHQVFLSNGAPVKVRDGALGAHIGYEPLLKDKVSYLHSPLEDAQDPGAGEMGKILLDFYWNGKVSSAGYFEMGKAVYDQKFWAEAYAPGFTAPTIRGTMDFALNITSIALGGVITPFAASLLNMVDDLLFAGLDLGFEYRTGDEVMKSLASTAATSLLSLGFDALGKTGIAKKIVTTFDKFKNIGGDVILKAGSAAVKSYTTTAAVNAIQSFNFMTGDFDTEEFTKSLYSARTLSGAVSAMVGTGLKDVAGNIISQRNQKLLGGLANLGVAGLTEASRYGVYAVDSIVNGNGSLGELLEQAYEDMGGITLNIANLGSILDLMGTLDYRMNEGYNTTLGALGQKWSGTGLLELNLGLNETSLSFGTGGIDLAGNLYNTVKHGLDYMSLAYGTYEGSENRDLLISNYLYGDWAAENTSMRIKAGGDILQVVEQGQLGATTGAQTKRQGDGTGRLITMVDSGDTNLNAVILQHESWRDGYVTSDNSIETIQAVMAHTQMAAKMLDDGIEFTADGLINDMMAYLVTGGDTEAFARYVSENYDSSGDYWRIIKDKEGKVIQVLDDGMYTTATIVEANGTATSQDITVGSSLSGTLAALVGNGMTKQEMNDIMVKSGLDYDSQKRIWYAIDERGVYVPPVKQPELSIPEVVLAEPQVIPETVLSADQEDVNPGFFQRAGAWIAEQGRTIGTFFENMAEFFKTLFVKKTDPVQPQEIQAEVINDPINEAPDIKAAPNTVVPEQVLEQNAVPGTVVPEQVIEQVIKTTSTIKGPKDKNVEIFTVDTGNPALSGLLSQHDPALKSVPTISASGCNFMVALGYAQLVAGKNLTAEQYLKIWADAVKDPTILNADGNVISPDSLSSIALEMLGRDDIKLTYGWKT